MTKTYLEPIALTLAGSFLLTGCSTCDNDEAEIIGASSTNNPPIVSAPTNNEPDDNIGRRYRYRSGW